MLTVLTGGARSGKSRAAAAAAAATARAVHVVVTAEAGDEEMAARIESHRRERPSEWVVYEEPVAVTDMVGGIEAGATVVVDCLALWVTNLLDRTDDQILKAATDLVATLAARPGATIVVTNEVGAGVVPEYPLARRFRDLLGTVNQQFVASADQAFLCVAGRLLALREPDAVDV